MCTLRWPTCLIFKLPNYRSNLLSYRLKLWMATQKDKSLVFCTWTQRLSTWGTRWSSQRSKCKTWSEEWRAFSPSSPTSKHSSVSKWASSPLPKSSLISNLTKYLGSSFYQTHFRSRLSRQIRLSLLLYLLWCNRTSATLLSNLNKKE